MKNPDSNLNRVVAPALRRTRLSLTVATAIVGLASPHAGAQTDAPAAPSSAASAAAPSAAASTPAAAPAAAPTTADKPESKKAAPQVLEAVTISATRRREPAREVPLVVNTLSAPQLERSGAASLSDYIGGLPGVDVKNDGGPGRGSISIRGASTGDQTIATVGVYIDDVAFGSNSAFVNGASTALDMSLLDLHHIELLRGPQGTLYGAGAIGGLLKYVTNEPNTYELSGKVSLALRSTRHGGLGHTESAIVNVPIKEDVAAVRVAVFHDHDGGFVDATGIAAGSRVNDGNTNGGRVSLLIEPSAGLKVRLTGTAQDLRRNGLNYVNYDMVTGQPLDGDLTRPLSTREPYNIRVRLGSADVEYDLGWARFNSITSVQHMDSQTGQDVSYLFGPAFGVPVVGLDNTLSLRKTTQEFRLTSARGTVEWLAGLYYDTERGGFDQVVWGQAVVGDPQASLITVGQPSRYREVAAYGDVTFNPAPGWSLTGGARVARNKQAYSTLHDGIVDPEAQSEDTSKTYLATVRYALNKESNVYFRAASGYRPGGPNSGVLDVNGQVVPDTPKSFRPDTLWSYELGYKADLLDKTLAVEGSLYTIRWNDIQQPIPIAATTINGNAGKAQVRGLELATRWQPTPKWSVDTSMAFVDAKLTEDAPLLGPSGSRLPNTARFSGALGLSHRFDVAAHPAYAGTNVRYVGARNAGFDAAGSSLPNFVLPAYTMVDLQGGVELGSFELGLFVRNLTDRRALLGADTHLVAFGFPLRANVAQPRTFGATLSAKF